MNNIEQIVMEISLKANINDNKNEYSIYGILNKYDIQLKQNLPMVENNNWIKFLKYFIDRKRISGKSERTLKLYNLQLKRLLSYLNKNIEDITENDLISYLEMYKSTRKVSNVYLDNLRLIMSSFFSWIYSKGFIKLNPTFGIEPIKIEKKMKRSFSDEDLENLKIGCKNKRDLALIEFLYSTGVRVSELSVLNKNDINFNTMSIIVYGKGKKEREVYLTPTSCLYLRKYLNSRKDNNDALFVNLKNPYNRLTVSGIEQIIRNLGTECGIDNVHPHKFRRTMATNLLNKGMPIEEVKELLGHTKLDTTMIYCNVEKENVKYSHHKYMCA